MMEDEIEWDCKFWNNYTAMYNELETFNTVEKFAFQK